MLTGKSILELESYLWFKDVKRKMDYILAVAFLDEAEMLVGFGKFFFCNLFKTVTALVKSPAKVGSFCR
jgi:hypothetical protein